MSKELPSISVDTHHRELSLAEERVFELLNETHRQNAIDIDDFKDKKGYEEKQIEKDKARIAKKKEDIEELGSVPSKRAKILEDLLIDQIELSNWFGENTYTVIPSEYDDLFNGIDLAIGIETDNKVKHLALSIDVTSSAKKIGTKLKKIKEHILDGSLTTMEYFHSDDYDPDIYKRLENIPNVIIGADRKTITELSELWLTAYSRKIKSRVKQPELSPEAQESQLQRTKEALKKLAEHRIQILLLEEIKMQLTVFINFALSREGAEEIARKLTSSLELINSVLKEKSIPSIDDVFKNEEDLVFQTLKETLDDFDNL